MIKIFKLDDEEFYTMLSPEGLEEFKIIKEIYHEKRLIPFAKITNVGYKNSWYSKHIGKYYLIYRYIIDTDNGYINFLVKSRDDGTNEGYKSIFSVQRFGKGIDIVHAVSCEIHIGFL